MPDDEYFLSLLKKEMVLARGCTEPAAVAIAAATAAKRIGGEIDKIEVLASTNILKNAMSVIIPGTGSCGVPLAAALGAVLRDRKCDLEILDDLSAEDLVRANAMVEKGAVTVGRAAVEEPLYILATVRSGSGRARAEIRQYHTNVTKIEVDGKVILEKKVAETADEPGLDLNLRSIWNFIRTVPAGRLTLLRQGAVVNKAVSQEGLRKDYGLRVGRTLMNEMDVGLLEKNAANYAMAVTSAAADARMSGCPLSVMSNSGSGNQGITATMPVVAFWEKSGLPEEKLLRALALSNLVAIHIKSKSGRLSALCGATIAGTGASCGITYLMGGERKEITFAVQNMIGNVTGMLCDGAKAGCALKISTCTSAAVQSAMLAMHHVCIKSTDGIVEDDVERTIDNFCSISHEETQKIDRLILSIMLKKANKS